MVFIRKIGPRFVVVCFTLGLIFISISAVLTFIIHGKNALYHSLVLIDLKPSARFMFIGYVSILISLLMKVYFIINRFFS